MNISRSCKVKDLNWESLPELEARLQKHGIKATAEYVNVTHYPDEIAFSSFDEAVVYIRDLGIPERYAIRINGKIDEDNFSLRISQGVNIHGNLYLYLAVESSNAKLVIDDVANFLALESDEIQNEQELSRTAFIAHRFDQNGEQCADRLARFLTMLEFDVQTGRGFTPASVAEKVRHRIEAQAILFVIQTPGEDPTWLTQESILGYSKDKPIFLLIDSAMDLKLALLGDLEYIPFKSPTIDTAFISIMEGLKELKYL